jgi:DNA-directed RNA polymerase specialized sigma subunit
MTPDPKTEKEIFHKHTPLVAAMVRQFAAAAPQAYSREQLHSLGLVALLGAVRHRQGASHVSFESFARSYIHDSLLTEMRRHKNWLAGAAEGSISNFARV